MPWGATWGSGRKGNSQREGEENWTKVFTVVSTGRNRRGRGIRLRVGYFKSFRWALGPRGVPDFLGPSPGVIWAGG